MKFFMIFDSAKQKINIKYFMTAYLALLLIFSAVALKQPMLIVRGVLIVFFYSLFDGVWTYLKEKTWYWPVSSWISGLILSLVAWPDMPWLFIVVLPLLAVFSKHVLHFGRARHVFNPAGFALAVTSFFIPVASWWGVLSGDVALVGISVAGVFILWRQSRWHEFAAFTFSYVFFRIVLSLASGIIDAGKLLVMVSQDLHGATIFFATVMIIEPVTSQFPSKKQRSVYAALVGIFASIVAFLLSKFPLFYADPLIFGLVLGNMVASLLFLPYASKQRSP